MAGQKEGFYNIPQNPYGKGIADFLQAAKGGLNKTFGIPGVELGIGLGDLLLGESPEYIEELSHGRPFIEASGHGGRLDTRAGDVLGIAGLLGNAPKNLAKGIYKGIAKDNLFGMPKGMMHSQQGYIMGINSNLADIGAYTKASLMKGAGASADEIFEKTKWWLDHPDKRPRFEVSHGAERMDDAEDIALEARGIASLPNPTSKQQGRLARLMRMEEHKTVRLKDMVHNTPISEHYPGMASDLKINTLPGYRSRGSFDADAETITIRPMGPSKRGEEFSTMQHELQHAIANAEDWSSGGSISGVRAFLHNKLRAEFIKRAKKYNESGQHDYGEGLALDRMQAELYRLRQPLGRDKNKAFFDEMEDNYLALADESQARLVQKRSHMSQDAMDADPFYERYDIPFNEMILKPQGK